MALCLNTKLYINYIFIVHTFTEHKLRLFFYLHFPKLRTSISHNIFSSFSICSYGNVRKWKKST